MKAFRKLPWFVVMVVGLSVAAAAELGGIVTAYVTAQSARRRLEHASRELRAVAAATPAPTSRNAALIEEDLARARRVMAELRGRFSDASNDEAKGRADHEPSQRSAAFFDLAAFVERMRDAASRHGVKLNSDERFGFAMYARDAPESERVAAVFRDRRALQAVLESLFNAHPLALLSVQREQPPKGGRKPARESEAKDMFVIDPRVSLRVPGRVATTAFRLSFTGRTEVLRTFVNALVGSDHPVLVRAIEVAPLEATPHSAASNGRDPDALVTGHAVSRFTVVIESVEFDSLLKKIV